MATVTRIIESIDWEMTKRDLTNAFSYMEALPPHPTQNAIGFGTTISDVPAAVVCYFRRKLFGEKLGAVNVIVYESPPSDEELQKTYKTVLDELTAKYGEPERSARNRSVWIVRGRVILASPSSGLIGVRVGDPRIDPPSAMAMGTEGN